MEEVKKSKEEVFKIVSFFMLLILFIILIILIKTNNTLNFDMAVYKFIATNIISEKITPVVKVITNLGGVLYFVFIAIGSLIIVKNRKIGLAVSLSIGLSALVNFIAKNIIQRTRPLEEFRLIKESGFSFPSGHSITSMVFYGFLIYLVSEFVKNKKVKYILTILFSILIVLIGLSRVYLGVHYITDVLGGFTLGLIFLILYISIYKKLTE